jgi:hypothetical protein
MRLAEPRAGSGLQTRFGRAKIAKKERATMWKKCLFLLGWIGIASGGMSAAAPDSSGGKDARLDFSGAVIVTPPDLSGMEEKAVVVEGGGGVA